MVPLLTSKTFIEDAAAHETEVTVDVSELYTEEKLRQQHSSSQQRTVKRIGARDLESVHHIHTSVSRAAISRVLAHRTVRRHGVEDNSFLLCDNARTKGPTVTRVFQVMNDPYFG